MGPSFLRHKPSSDCVDPPLTGWRDFGGVFAQDEFHSTLLDLTDEPLIEEHV